MTAPLVVVRGGGDLGTGVAHTLHKAGYRVVVLEAERPRAVRRMAAFAQAVYAGRTAVEGIEALVVSPLDIARAAADIGLGGGAAGARVAARGALEQAARAVRTAAAGWAAALPVVVDPDGAAIRSLRPDAIVDARMAKRNLGTTREDAPVTIGLGPGFEAGRDVDVVIETNRGSSLGSIIERGSAEADTGVPAEVAGASADRVLRAPVSGEFSGSRRIGDLVSEGETVGTVGGASVTARIGGLLRGLAADGLSVAAGEKVGDVDPRGAAVDPAAISEKARAVGRAVLAALRARGIVPAGESPAAGAAPGVQRD